MTTVDSVDVFKTSWQLDAAVEIEANVDLVYDMVSDITRMGDWSPECIGGRWTDGAPGRVGARFHGVNREGDAVWTSESEVIEAQRPTGFGFSVLAFCPGEPTAATEWVSGSQLGDMTWRFEIEDRGGSCVLRQFHTMKVVSPFYRVMIEAIEERERLASVRQRREQLQQSMEQTLARVKKIAEAC